MPTVYVIQEQRNHNISPALKYGEIKVLLPPGDANFSAQDTYNQLQRGVCDYVSRHDYLLLTGDPVMIVLATHIAARQAFGPDIKLLKWDRQTSQYLVIEVSL